MAGMRTIHLVAPPVGFGAVTMVSLPQTQYNPPLSLPPFRLLLFCGLGLLLVLLLLCGLLFLHLLAFSNLQGGLPIGIPAQKQICIAGRAGFV